MNDTSEVSDNDSMRDNGSLNQRQYERQHKVSEENPNSLGNDSSDVSEDDSSTQR